MVRLFPHQLKKRLAEDEVITRWSPRKYFRLRAPVLARRFKADPGVLQAMLSQRVHPVA